MPKRRKLDAGAEERQRFYQFRDACYADRGVAAKMLSEDPTLISVRNGIGETALHYLAIENDISAVEWLIERGADVNTKNDFGSTPIQEAAQLVHLEMSRLLLDRGAILTERNQLEQTPISAAVESIGKSSKSQEKTLALVTLLLERLPESEDLNDHFDRWEAEEVLAREDQIAALFVKRGLKRPSWSE